MHVKAQVILQGNSNKPEDRYVNTFHFNKAWASLVDAKDTLGPALQAFYDTPVDGNNNSIGKFFHPYISSTVTAKFYDLADPEPRVPQTHTWTITGKATSGGLPEEVAVVCSFSTVPPLTPSRRGRIYLGPLTTSALMGGGTASKTSVSAQFMSLVASKAKALADGDFGWSVYSQKNGTLSRVMQGWCDDAFDIQRRRGMRPSTRNTWSSSWTGSF